LKQENLLVNIELLGVNRPTDNIESYNNLTTMGNVLPWLQDTPEANTWVRWAVTYRDVVILDSSNRFAGVLNLTTSDLALEANRIRLKEMLRAVANAGDSDRDKLPDHWEHRYLGGLSAGPDDESDHDGHVNRRELAFGTKPNDPADFPRITLGFTSSKQFQVSFDRWSGAAAEYLVEMSTNLVQWTNSAVDLRTSTTNYFDGTGRARSTHSLTRSSTTQPAAFLRINTPPKP
jgi:hypothetical protein